MKAGWWLGLIALALLGGLSGGDAAADASPIAHPVVRADASLEAMRARAWTADGAQWLLLEEQVVFQLGVYGFRAQRAVVRIDREDRIGVQVHHLSIYLDQARSIHGNGPVNAQAPRLLVTASTTGRILMNVSVMSPTEAAPVHDLVQAADARMQRQRDRLAAGVRDLDAVPLYDRDAAHILREARRETLRERLPRIDLPDAPEPEPRLPAVVERPEPDPDVPDAPAVVVTPEPPSPEISVLPTRGVLSFHADRVVFDADDNGESALSLIGSVRLFYQDYEHGRNMSLKAERMVIFAEAADRDMMQGRQLDARTVRGVYLEDNVVITDGQYTVRAPRVYYDLQLNRAILLEAVMYTWDVRRRIPLYMRADVMRQTAATAFRADNALLTTSEFAEPHVAIGAGRLTVEQTEDDAGRTVHRFEAKDAALRVGDVPLLWAPKLAGQAGDATAAPLRSVSAGYSNRRGPVLETGWDMFALTGQDKPEGVDMIGKLDLQGRHGFGTGLELAYELEDMFGSFDAYLLPYDTGRDQIGQRQRVDHDGDIRGFVHLQHRHYLDRYDLELSLEASYVSDPTFLEEFFPNEAYAARTYETSIYLKKQEEDWALTLLAGYDLNNFTPQLTTLQAPGYTVDRAPELGYYRVGTSLWEDRLTWFSENRLSRVRMRFGSDRPERRGFRDQQALDIFGIPADMSFREAADMANMPRDWRYRFDTRQEINMPLRLGMFDVVPYATGRITGYDSDFEQFSGEDDQVRFWGAVGTRVHTQFVREYNAESALLDVHRLRHIVEPMLDVFLAGSTMNPEDLPNYDHDVEGISKGAGIRLGLRNTLQTQRGGPGRWRSVDWITLQTDVVLRSSDTDTRAQIARFFDYRPEFATGGSHFYSHLMWMVTDTLGLHGEITQLLDHDTRTAYWRVGATLQHTPRLGWYLNYEEINALNSRLISYGFDYQLTSKYYLSFGHRIDFDRNDSRDLEVALERRLPRWRLRVVARYDQIDDETTVGVVLLPEGFAPGIETAGLLGPRR